MSVKIVQPLKTKTDCEDFCRLPMSLLASIGIDYVAKPRAKWMKVLMSCYFLAAAISNLYVFTFITIETYAMIMSDNFELSLVLRLISGFNYTLCATIKCISLLWRLREFNKIYQVLAEIYPKSEKEKAAFKVQQHFWPKWILFIVYFYLGATASIVISPLLEGVILYIMELFKVGLEESKFGYLKLYEIDYSFDHHNPWAYIATYCIEFMHAHFIILSNISADIRLLCVALQLCMHFDYLTRLLEEYKPDEVEFEKDQQFIADFVKKHQILLNLSNGLNKVFGVLLVLLLMSTAATLCCAGVYTITQGVGREFLEYAAFLPTAIGQYYLICYYGQKLATMSLNVADAAYNQSWYNGSQLYKKSILIIIMRSQKEVELNACGYQPICMEAFKMVMGATYRVFALLKETML